MYFLLVSPIRSELTRFVSGEGATDDRPLDSRKTSNVKLLNQEWTDFPVLEVPGFPEISITRSQLCKVQGQKFFVVQVSLPDDLVFRLDVEDLEQRLSRFAHQSATLSLAISGTEVPWVARYALINEDSEAPTNWIDSRTQLVDISNDSLAQTDCRVKAALGWGNGAVLGWDCMSGSVKDRFVHGILDAQVIWNNASQIIDKNKTVFDALVEEIVSPSRRAVREISPECAQIQMYASVHQLLYDDLFQNVQGIRRSSADLLLRAWEYERLVDRMLARVSDTTGQLELLRARLDSRYHSAVQSTLLVLGFLVVIDTALSFISTAYSGSVSGSPDGALGMFSRLRKGDADIILALSFLTTTGLAIVFTRRR